jgi:hypothetical protein
MILSVEGQRRSNAPLVAGCYMHVIWNAWKERNRRIFTGQRLTYIEVASITREDIL